MQSNTRPSRRSLLSCFATLFGLACFGLASTPTPAAAAELAGEAPAPPPSADRVITYLYDSAGKLLSQL